MLGTLPEGPPVQVFDANVDHTEETGSCISRIQLIVSVVSAMSTASITGVILMMGDGNRFGIVAVGVTTTPGPREILFQSVTVEVAI